MDPQLLRPVATAAAAEAVTAEAAGPRGVVYGSSSRQEQLLRLAMQRQLQQEQRQQQHLKQHQVRKDRPEEQHDTLLDEQRQCGDQKEPQYHLEERHQLRQPHQEPLLKYSFSRTEGMRMEQNSCTVGLGSGSVSTANSGSERSSRNASDDEATVVRKRPELQKKWTVEELVYKEDRVRKIPNLSMAQKFTHENVEPLYEQRWQPGLREDPQQQPQQRQGEEHKEQPQQQQQQQQLRSQIQQQQQELTQQQCRPRQPRHHLQQQQQQLNVNPQRTVAGKNLPPYAEEIGLGLHVGATFLGRRHAHSSAELPPLPPRFAHTTDAVPAEQGLFHTVYETGFPGGPVRPARKKVLHPTPSRRTFSSSVPASASSASKERVRNRAGRTYLNSRITEVRSFAGTLEEYLLFRRQQAERREAVAAAAAHSGTSGFRAVGPANQHLIERMKASTTCSGHRRGVSVGRHDFTGITATAHSSRSSSCGASATPRCKDGERMQQYPLWEPNVAVQQRQRRTAHGIFQQLSTQISESSQQGGNRVSGGTCATSGHGSGDATAARNHDRTSKGQNPMLQLRTSTGNSSSPRVARGDDKTEGGAEDERKDARLSNSSATRPRRREVSSFQTQESQTDNNSSFPRGDTRKCASATSADNQQEHVTREGSVPCSGEREEAPAAGGDAKNTDEHSADEQKTRGRGRKFIPLEMRNGEILWPTDRPIIPLNAWIFQNFSSDEPLDPQNWVHLPNVGPAISPAISALHSPQEQSEHPPTRPPVSCSTAPLVRSPLVAEAHLTEPVKLPPIKLSIGCEVPRFIIQTSTLPEMSTQTEMPPNSSAPTIHGKKIRSRSSSGRLGGAPAARLKSVYTQFYKQSHVRHRPTNFEGLVVRAEDAGRVLVVRSKDGHLRKLHRDECEAVGFICASAPPPERSLTDAAHVHSTHLLSATSGSLAEMEACSSPGSAVTSAGRGSAHLRTPTFSALPVASSARKPPLPPKRDHLRQTTRQGTHVQKHAPGGHMLGAALHECPALPRHHDEASRAFLNIYGSSLKPGPAAASPLLQRNEEACNRTDKEQTRKLALQQVPDLQEVLKLAQQHASGTMPNTVALKNMATIPAIRAVDSQVTVEAIRVKRYTLEGQDEENLLPVFSADASTQNNRASSIASAAARPAATYDERGAPPDAAGLLLQKHDALQVLKKREEQLATDEVIYAQDAPEATRARGIAPPTILKESLVIPPKEDELLYYPQQAPGIMPPLNQYLKKTGKFHPAGCRAVAWPKGSDASSASTETPDMQHVNGEDHRRTGEGQERTAANDSLLLDAEGPAWFSDLKAQFKNKLLHQYLQTGSMEAAALAISSGGYTPLSFTASYPHIIQRKEAKVLRDELRHMQFAPVGQNEPL